MPVPNDILDYASPRPRGRYRLPSVSRLEVQRDSEGLVVIETLRGKGGAIFAIGFGLFTLVTLPMTAREIPQWGTIWTSLQNPNTRGPTALGLGLLSGLWLADAVLMVLVANNTWRKTILDARDGTLTLTFRSPLGQRVRRWPFEQILELGVDRTLEIAFTDPRLELLLRAHGGQLIHLFADHGEHELESIVAALKDLMGWPFTRAVPTGAAGTARPPTGLPD